jgi:hypothetical protein
MSAKIPVHPNDMNDDGLFFFFFCLPYFSYACFTLSQVHNSFLALLTCCMLLISHVHTYDITLALITFLYWFNGMFTSISVLSYGTLGAG